jgi:uncharacterized protein (TIGR02246 family)
VSDDLRAALDWSAIHNVITFGAIAQDAHDWDGVAGCYEPDAVYVHPGGRIEGATEIVERSRRALTPLDASQHLVGSVHITVDGDTASSTAYFQAQHVRHDAEAGPLFVIAGTYSDVLVRRDGRWRISQRTQTYTWRDGNPAVIVRNNPPA